MALDSQIVSISLRQGLDQKTDDKQVVPGKLLVLENGVFSSPGMIQKRPGARALSRDRLAVGADGESSISAGEALATFNDELLLSDGEKLFSFNSSAEKWVEKGPISSVGVSQTPIVRDTWQQASQDGVTHPSGLQCYAWQDSRGATSIRYSIVDGTTGQTIVSSAELTDTGVKVKTLVLGNRFLFLWLNPDTSRLNLAALPVYNPAASLTPMVLTAASGANAIDPLNPLFDATVSGSPSGERLYLAFRNDDNGTTFRSYNSNSLSVIASEGIFTSPADAITIFPMRYGEPGIGAVLWSDIGPVKTFYVQRYTYALGDPTGFSFAGNTVAVQAIAGVSVSDTSFDFRCYWVEGADDPANTVTHSFRATAPNSAGTSMSTFETGAMRSVGLAAKPFVVDGVAHVPLVHESLLQPTYFIAQATDPMDFSASPIVAKALASVGGGMPASFKGDSLPLLPEVSAAGSSSYRIALLQKDFLTSLPSTTQITSSGTQTSGLYTQTGVTAVTLDFAGNSRWQRAEFGGSLQVGGGVLQMYDGQAPVELGFHLYPELDPATALETTSYGGSIGAGQRWYSVVYAWTDANGLVHRSAPSVPISTSLLSGSTNRTWVTVPSLRLTNKRGARGDVFVEVYRTAANGETFYLACSSAVPQASTALNRPVINDTTVDSVVFEDRLSDLDIAGNPQLYSLGGVLENIAPPPVAALTVHRNRLFVVDSTNRLQVWYSKEVQPGVAPPEFNDALFLNIDPRGGPVTALASLDDKLIVFKRDRIFLVSGQGPDATGAQNMFSDATLVTTDCGCVNPRSVANVPAGIVFQSTKGIMLLDRGLSPSYVGVEVESFNSETVTSTLLVAASNQVRFFLESGRALVYDYLVGQWSVFTPMAAVDSILWGGVPLYLRSDGTACQETPGAFSDPGGRWIRLKLQTGWLSFAGLQGYQRVRELMILGEYASPHRLFVSAAYDFNNVDSQQLQVQPTTPRKFGTDATYGQGTPFGGALTPYQHRLQLQRQKTQAIRLTIEDVEEGTAGEGMSLSALALEVGVKPGLYRRQQARTT